MNLRKRIKDWIDTWPVWNAVFLLIAVLIVTGCWLAVILVK